MEKILPTGGPGSRDVVIITDRGACFFLLFLLSRWFGCPGHVFQHLLGGGVFRRWKRVATCVAPGEATSQNWNSHHPFWGATMLVLGRLHMTYIVVYIDIDDVFFSEYVTDFPLPVLQILHMNEFKINLNFHLLTRSEFYPTDHIDRTLLQQTLYIYSCIYSCIYIIIYIIIYIYVIYLLNWSLSLLFFEVAQDFKSFSLKTPSAQSSFVAFVVRRLRGRVNHQHHQGLP